MQKLAGVVQGFPIKMGIQRLLEYLLWFPNISVNFEDKKMAYHILDIQTRALFGVKCYNCVKTK